MIKKLCALGFLFAFLLFAAMMESPKTDAYNTGMRYPEGQALQSIGYWKWTSTHSKTSYHQEQYSGFFNGAVHGFDRISIYDRYCNIAPYVQQRLTSTAYVFDDYYEVTETFQVGFSTTQSLNVNIEGTFQKVLKASIGYTFSKTVSTSSSTSVTYRVPTIKMEKQFLGLVLDARIQRYEIFSGRYYILWVSTFTTEGYVITPWTTSDSYWAVQPIFVNRQEYYDFNGALSYLEDNL